MTHGKSHRRRLEARRAARAAGPAESPWPRCPECGRAAMKIGEPGVYHCPKDHRFRE